MTNITDTAKATGTVYRLADAGNSGQFPNTVKRVLVATDLTTESERAIDFALALAKRFRAPRPSKEAYAACPTKPWRSLVSRVSLPN